MSISYLDKSANTLSTFIPGISHLLMATIIGTSAFLACLIASMVCGITESSAATTKITISVMLAPLSLIFKKAECPGVSRKVIVFFDTGVFTENAPICWVIPPNSLFTMDDFLKKSRMVVFPWSTWPMIVTIGGLGFNFDSSATGSGNKSSPVSSFMLISYPYSSAINETLSLSKI